LRRNNVEQLLLDERVDRDVDPLTYSSGAFLGIAAPVRIWFGILACFWLTMGATFQINYITNRRSHDILGELAALKQRLQELQEIVERRRN
jgi:hypothetical protein